MATSIWFIGWLLAFAILARAAIRIDHALSLRAPYVLGCVLITAATALMLGGNRALTLHDYHFDLTRDKTYTLDPNAAAVVAELDEAVRLTYFYRHDDPSGQRARRIVEQMDRLSDHLDTTVVDPDKNPALTRASGTKFYNVALLEASGRRLTVQSTNEVDIANGMQRLLRKTVITVCFTSGHGEYAIDNDEFHTHYEGATSAHADHDHGDHSAVIETTAHGYGRFRRSLEALGYNTRVVLPAVDKNIDPLCNLLAIGAPQSALSPLEVSSVSRYLENGGNALLMLDVNFPNGAADDRLLAKFGVELSDHQIIDRDLHYGGDTESVAVTAYGQHAITNDLSFSFYPGVRALARIDDLPENITVTPLMRGGPASELVDFVETTHRHTTARTDTPIFALAVTGRLPGASQEFRTVVIGDGDFASNSFYPYMSNHRVALNMVRWLVREDDKAAAYQRIPTPPIVALTSQQQRTIFVLLVVVLPAIPALLGFWIWHSRQ